MDGSSYDGNWENSKRCGAGTESQASGKKQQGFWKDDKYLGTEDPLKVQVKVPEVRKSELVGMPSMDNMAATAKPRSGTVMQKPKKD
jgi:hypothetical protein